MKSNLPVILLKNLVLLPYQEIRVELKNEISKRVTEISKLYHDSEVLVVCPLDPLEENPDTSDLPKVGVVGKIKNIIELPNGNMRLLISGLYRVKIIDYVNYSNESEVLDAIISSLDAIDSEIEQIAYARKLRQELESYIDKNPFISNSILAELREDISLEKLTDLVANFLTLNQDKKLSLMIDPSGINRCKSLIKELAIESAYLELEGHLDNKIQENLDETQKEYILKEKLKVIRNELGEALNRENDIISLKERVSSLNLPIRIETKLLKEIHRLDTTSEMSPDAGIIRNYIEYLLEIPWTHETKDEKDLIKIEKKLNSTHYSLDEVKDRIIEYMAVKSITDEVNTPIICLVGPPGVGKTTFAESIANAINRNFVKISLGGMSDSSELVGHRRTYIGSTPGKIVSSLIKCGSINPVFLLDEVDKLKKDYKGDPASTLLDILDPSQNKRFVDNYIDEEIDLSKVLFILTANDISSIPLALLDRLEIINLSGYSDQEKLYIAEQHLIPNILKKHGLSKSIIKFEEDAIKKIITDFTNENGVRELERCLNKITRKVITSHIKSSRKIVSIRIRVNDLSVYLSNEIKTVNHHIKQLEPGIVKAVASNGYGGFSLNIECSSFKGTGKITYTGFLGDIVKESVEVSLNYIKSNCDFFEIDENFFSNNDIHIHFTENGISKDGPSAGIAITTAILSLIKGITIDKTISMTGEITLKGEVLRVSGIKEKSIAALRNEIDKLLVPYDNISDVEKIDNELKENINYKFVNDYKEIYELLFK